VKDFREILVWPRSHAFTVEIYRLSAKFPKEETFGLTSQMRRAASSIPANISEGCGRDGDPELKRFMTTCELDYFILLASELGYIQPLDRGRLSGEILEIRRMLGGFIQKLKA